MEGGGLDLAPNWNTKGYEHETLSLTGTRAPVWVEPQIRCYDG
jgi:hypothetical protein